MMVSGVRTVLAGLILCLGGCSDKQRDELPSGQVIATADGLEITQRELAAELDLIGESGNRVARQAALQQIIARKLLEG